MRRGTGRYAHTTLCPGEGTTGLRLGEVSRILYNTATHCLFILHGQFVMTFPTSRSRLSSGVRCSRIGPAMLFNEIILHCRTSTKNNPNLTGASSLVSTTVVVSNLSKSMMFVGHRRSVLSPNDCQVTKIFRLTDLKQQHVR